MEFNLSIGENNEKVKVDNDEKEGSYRIAFGDETLVATPCPASENLLHLQMENRPSLNLYIVKVNDGVWVWHKGKARFIQDADQLSRKTSKRKNTLDQPKEITPQTPSTVVSVLVEIGQEVDKGQEVIILSAMKMENTLTAPYSGTVSAVNAGEGHSVSPGEILIEIEADNKSEDEGEKANE